MKKFAPFWLAGALCAMLSATPTAHAVVLENKWHAGEQLPYEVTLNGTLNLQADANAPVMWAGMPLEVELDARSNTILNTLEVAPDGAGKIAVKMPLISLRGKTLGQNVEWSALDGTSQFTMNGKPMSAGKPGDAALLENPPILFKISRQGRLMGIEPLPKPATAGVPVAPDAAPAATGTPATMEQNLENALDKNALFQALILRALPSLWPNDDLQVGNAWKATVEWPMFPGQAADEAPIGNFDLKLTGEELLEGRTVQRISLDGTLKIDDHKAALINEGAADAKPTAKPSGRLKGLLQTVTGDVWFDAAAGQMVRANLNLTGFVAGEGAAKNGSKGPATRADFAGVLTAQLKPVAP